MHITLIAGARPNFMKVAALVHAVAPALRKLFAGEWKKGAIPELWDGHAAKRIIKILSDL